METCRFDDSVGDLVEMAQPKRFLIGSILIFLLISVGIGFALYRYAMDSQFRVSSEVAKDMIAKGNVDVILDVRTDFERNTLGFYPNSVHIQSGDLQEQMPMKYPNKNIHILAYCNTGQRSRKATEILHSLGYKNVVYISGSYKTLLQ